MAAIDAADAESCGTCHGGVGDEHQAVYNEYVDASMYVLTVDNVQSAAAGLEWALTIDFSIDYNGAPLIDPAGQAPSAQTLSFAPTKYDGGAVEFQQPGNSPYPSISAANALSNGDGTYTLVQNVEYDIDSWTGGAVIGRIANGDLNFPDGPTSHFGVYANLTHDAFEFGTLDTWESAANVAGCENCHGAPYRKHGNIEANVAGAPEFTRCKSCHFDDKVGGHEDWQYMVDDPLNWANGVDPAPNAASYAYTANLMNDVHMSHAMEFPYPMSMSNCNTCHENKLDDILVDPNFTAETCKSCHVIQGNDAWPEDAGTTEEGMYAQPHRPPPLEFLWTKAGVEVFHTATLDCTACHGLVAGVPTFAELHTGYDDHIYNDAGAKYSVLNTVSVDTVTRSGDLLTVNFTATNPEISPTLAISFYGWDSKHFIVPAHERDGNGIDCPHSSRPGCNIEWSPGSTKPFFTEDPASVAGDWMVTFDMSLFQAVKTDPIPQLITDGAVKYAEITILPTLVVGTADVVLEAVSTSYDLGGSLIVEDYFQGANASVDIEKCNACHDTLGSTFHAGRGRGGDSMQTCKVCHATTFPGSHIEMASRSIDSYVHAIHSFQPFDEDDVAADDDPVFNARNAQHKSHTFPYFTALACEGCHVDGTYNVPDQSKSMPGVLSASYDIEDRNIGTVPEAVTGPASRACGACHRANMIVADEAGDLAAFNAHTDAFGTLEENDDEDMILFGIIDKIMSMFQ
jgi:OmcA/MtrC family decaheme c-type cytochrome